MSDVCCVLITASTVEEARKIAHDVLHERLAACVNIVPSIESHYWWQGKLEQAGEALLIAKTPQILVARLIERVKASHSYSVPEVIAVHVVEGNPDYLSWIRAETTEAR